MNRFVPPAPATPRCALCQDVKRISLFARWRNSCGWEGRVVAVRASRGFHKSSSTTLLDQTRIRIGSPVTEEIVLEAQHTLLRTGLFDDVQIEVSKWSADPGRVKVLTIVSEKGP